MKFLAFYLSASVLLLLSCNKSTSDAPPNPKVKSVTYSFASPTLNNSVTRNLLYDANGVIIGTQGATPDSSRASYEVNGNKNTHKRFSGDLLTYISDAFVIPGTTNVDSTYEINYGLGDTLETKYHYNNAGQVISSDEINHSRFGVDLLTHVDYSYDGNGDLIKKSENTEMGLITYTYTYDMEVLIVKLAPEGLAPKIAIHRPTKLVIEGLYHDNEVFMEYTFDSQHRVTTEVTTSVKHPDDVTTITYTYY